MKKLIKAFIIIAMLICIAVPFASCKSGNALESPAGFSVDENYNLTWSPVENARSYALEIKNVETGAREEATTRRESVSLSYLGTGDYDIRVKAVGDGSRFLDSDWSTTVPFERAYESGCQYRLINNGSEYEVASVSLSATELALEDSYRGKPVTSIGDSAFRRASKLESLSLGKYVTDIGKAAFYNCVELKNISIPNGVTSIGQAAFQSCRSLVTFEVPAGVTALEANVFAYCRGLKEVNLNNVTQIGESAFSSCTALEEFTFTPKIVSIGSGAFLSATALKKVNMGDNVIAIGTRAFSNCSALTTVNFSDRGNLKYIGDNAFEACALPTVALPAGLESIGRGAFYFAEELETVSIPESVTSIGERAFFGTKFYKDAYNADEMFVYADKWLVGCTEQNKKLVYLYDQSQGASNTYCLQEDTVGIANYTFAYNQNLADVRLAKNVKYVGAYAFAYCPALYRFTSKDTALVSLGAGAFWQDSELIRVELVANNEEDQLKEINDYAFYGCTSLNYVSEGGSTRFIPESVERIGRNAFENTGFYDKDEETKAYKNADEYGVIYADDWVVGCTGTFYQLAGASVNGEPLYTCPNQTFANITLKPEVRGISDFAFYNCRDIVTIQNAFKPRYIGRGAFYNCIQLEIFPMNDNIEKIEPYTFYGCNRLKVENLPANLTSVGRSAFYQCYQLNEVRLSRNVKSVGDFAFYQCGATKISLGTGLTELGNYVFYGCPNLTTVTVPGNIKKIGRSAFSGCAALEELILEEGVEEIGDFAFRSNEALKEISLPASVKRVGNNAFLQCYNVKSIDLGRVEEIGNYAFAENLRVRELFVPDSVKTIGKGAFCYLGANAMDGLGNAYGSATNIIISGSVNKIEVHAFYGCSHAVFFMQDENRSADWGWGWNSDRRPVLWGVTLSEDGGYVVSFTAGENALENYEALNRLGAPYRQGYTFAGWSLSEGGTSVAYTMQTLASAPAGTQLYAVYIQE